MEGNASSCILELNSLECMAPMITMREHLDIPPHPSLELHLNLEVRRITSPPPSLSDLVKMAPRIFQEPRKYRRIKCDMGKQ